MSGTTDEPLKTQERIFAESRHRGNLDRRFNGFPYEWNTYVPEGGHAGQISDHDEERVIAFLPKPGESLERATKHLVQLSSEDIRPFCFKDCAIYALTENRSHTFWKLQLLEKVYRHWFPSRAQDTDISHESFFCQFIDFSADSERPSTIREVLQFHRALCSRLDELVPMLAGNPPRKASALAEQSLQSSPVEYCLRQTFKDCFLALPSERKEHSIDGRLMKEQGVIIVFMHAEAALRHGCETDEERGIATFEIEDYSGDARAFRCSSLEGAMSIVLATDLQRRMDKREQHGYYGDNILDQNDHSPMENCICTGCRPEFWDVARLRQYDNSSLNFMGRMYGHRVTDRAL